MNAKWLGWLLCLAPIYTYAQSAQDTEAAIPVESVGASPVDSAVQRALATAPDPHSRRTAPNVVPAAGPAPTCLTDTSQTNFQAGTATNVDVNVSPGNVVLVNVDRVDQQNTALGTSGVGITTTTWGGQTFTPSSTGQLTRVDINLFCSGCTGTTPNLTLSLRATSGGLPTGADLAATTVTGFSSGAAAFYTATFATPATLTAGTQYAVVIRPTVNPSPGTYALTRSGTATAGSDVYAGGTRVAGATSGTVWSIPLTGGTSTDAGFKIYLHNGFDASGTFDSSTKDANPLPSANVTWTTLSWDAVTPASTAVQFQVAGSTSLSGPFNFVGPDNTSATYFSNGGSLSQFNGLRYLKYRAVLSTSDITATPTLNDATVCYANLGPSDLSVTVADGVTTAVPGKSVTYTITASNAGPADADGANLSDNFPPAETCTWTCAGAGGGTCTASGSGSINDTINLPAGGSVTYTASCSISSSATGAVSNTATVSTPAGVTDPTNANNTDTAANTLTPTADLAITNTDGVSTATPGGSVTYTITASNAGPSDAPGATVADTFPAAETCTWTCVGAGGGTCTASGSGNINDTVSLSAGASVTYTASCAISSAAIGSLSNTATVTAPGGVTDPTPGNNSATDSDTLTPSADLAITNTDGVATATAGGSVTYTIAASNAGPSNAPGALVADTFPANETCTWTCGGAGGGTCTASGSGNINDTINLPAGGSVSYTASCTISSAATGTLSNTATVAAPGGVTDPAPGNNSATDNDTLNASADLSITNSDGVTAVTAGGSTTYAIVAHNAGPSNAPGATVSDLFPAGETCHWTCAGSGGGTCAASGNGNIADTVNLPSGASVSYAAVCSIAFSASGTLSNVATVTAPVGVTDAVPGNNSATDNDIVNPAPAASVSGTKTVGAVGGFRRGTNVIYTIVLHNGGTGAQGDNPGDEFVDTLDPALTFVSANATGGGAAFSGGAVHWNGSIAAGGDVTITIVATINNAATGTINNQGTISWDSNGDGINDTTTLTDDPSLPGSADPTPFTVAPSLSQTSLVSSINPSTFGQSVTFTATVSAAPSPPPTPAGVVTVRNPSGSGARPAASTSVPSVSPPPSTPTGTVTFFDGGNSIGTGTLSAGVATLTTSTLATGNHTITASYGGDADFNGSTGSLTGNPQVINKATQTITFTSTPPANPTAGATYTAAATASSGLTVTLSIDAASTSNVCSIAGNVVSFTGAGNCIVDANQAGNANYAAAAQAQQTITVGRSTSSLTLQNSLNPSLYGQAVTFTATVSGQTPTGTVTFTAGALTLCSTVTLSSSTATCTTTALPVGGDTITAAYSGDVNNAAASATLAQTVNVKSTTVSLAATPNPAVSGQTVTLTATVGGDPPSGTVTFTDNGAVLACSPVTLTPGTTSSTAVCANTFTAAGAHSISAIYSGDANYATATSAVAVVTVNAAVSQPTVAAPALDQWTMLLLAGLMSALTLRRLRGI